MKNSIFFIIVSAILLLSCLSKSKKENTNLSIPNQNPVVLITKLDSSYLNDTIKTLFVKVTLWNQTIDTFKYIRMLCAWKSSFTIAPNDIKIYDDYMCSIDKPATIDIPPLGSEVFLLKLTTEKGKQFTLGFNLIAPSYKQVEVGHLSDSIQNMKHVIWSNSITFNN